MSYTKRIYTDKVFGMTDICPECKRLMTATGKLLYDSPPQARWVVQFYCARCREFFSIVPVGHEARIHSIVEHEPAEDVT
jgi:hypothetical protein